MRKKRIKRSKDPFITEIKRVLLYHVEIDTDGRFKAVDRARLQTWGPAEGEHKILTVGMSHREYIYTSDLNNTKAIYQVRKALERMGRGVNLATRDGAACSIVKSVIFYPVLVVFYENDDGDLELDFYTARTFNAWLAILRVSRKFDKVTDGIVSRVANEKSYGKYKRMFGAISDSLKSLSAKKTVSDIDMSDEETDAEDDENYEDSYVEDNNDENGGI